MNSGKFFLSLFAASVVASSLTAYLTTCSGPGRQGEASSVPERKPAAFLPGADRLQTEFSEAISKSMPAVVLITAQKRIGVMSPYSNIYDYSRRRIDYLDVPSGQGSGFFIREDGYILTNYHVVRNQDSFWITTHSGEEFPAQVVRVEPPADSGGPLLNIRGEVIGVNDFILSPSGGNIGLSFAISSDIAKKVSDELISRGHVERPWLGIVMQALDRDARKQLKLDHGVAVAQVFRGSPAAGRLRRGDIILKANGKAVSAPYDLQGIIFSLSPGASLKLEVLRGSTTQEVTLTVQKSPRNWFRPSPDQQSESLPVRQL